MPRTRRSRVFPAEPGAVWAVVGDPHHLPRWWPRIERVEQVAAGAFTEVMRSERGKTVRVDQHLSELEENDRIAWSQEIEGTPFARVLSEATTRVSLEPAEDGGTKVTVERHQTMRGWARFGGGLMIRRATSKVLDEALSRLGDVVVAPPA